MKKAIVAKFAVSSLLLLSFVGCLPVAGQGGGRTVQVSGRKQKGILGEPFYDGPDRGITSNNLVGNASFNDGTSLPWTVSFTAPADGAAEVKNKSLCVNVKNRGLNNWDAQLRHREMVVKKGHTYVMRFKAFASASIRLRAKVGEQGPPYREYWVGNLKLDEKPRTFEGTFVMTTKDDPMAEFTFHFGGNLAFKAPQPFFVCFDDVRLEDTDFVRAAPPPAEAPPLVRVNQVGYAPQLVKFATLISESREPVQWRLRDSAGQDVSTGKTAVHGVDAPSGDSTHVIDFSRVDRTGTGFVLEAAASKSHPFDIGKNIYETMAADAFHFFYQNRSGIEIAMPYAKKPEWARPAGHLSDKKVPCAESAGCDYSLDVAGGWYDAGDHGKYIVNGGIAVWTLLNLWERSQHLGGSHALLDDGKFAIPEQGNKVPDLLDEVRWNLDFMLKMQVPDGQQFAGMAHHKIHDREWTALGLAPHDDPVPRFLQPVSTAATLNLAAVAAQGARIYRPYNAAFSDRCLQVAEKAFVAAQKNPKRFAPGGTVGGGPYDDVNVDDEFYWAASELFVTTGKDEYRNAMGRTPFFLKLSAHLQNAKEAGMASPMNWQETEALGTISLAIVPNKLSDKDRGQARSSIVAAAREYAAMVERRGYRVPIEYGTKNMAAWGSNSMILNNMIVLALGYDLSDDKKLLDAVVQGMDYLLGRNGMDQSYVTGYGDRPVRNPHHRFWAKQVSPKFPSAPPGIVSGGPNSGLEDPYVQAAGLKGCAAEKCYVDHIEAWSANEITINWNAPFAWTAAFLDEQAGKPRKSAAPTPTVNAKTPKTTKRKMQ